ncbi:MAG: dimethylsulfoniopropionate demethylase [Chloroflexota bacterium]
MNHPVPQIARTARIRKSPYYEATIKHGIKVLSVYNHMYMPSVYHDLMTDYENLTKRVTLWDVAVERQVEIKGPDAARFTQYLTCRDISQCSVGQCMYVPIIDDQGGVLNDPIMLKLAEDHFWLSLADYDILLWGKGLNVHLGLDVALCEPDVSPLAVQGPKSRELMVDLFGDWINDLKFFWFREATLNGIPMVIARSGWSKQGGYELYLQDGSRGVELWETIFEAGKKYNIAPGAPHGIERIESSLLDFGHDVLPDMNPWEAGLDQYVHLDMAADFVGKEALKKIAAEGVKRRLMGITLEGDPLPVNDQNWPVHGYTMDEARVTSFTWSPRYQQNIGMALLPVAVATPGSQVTVDTPLGPVTATVVTMPFTESLGQG